MALRLKVKFTSEQQKVILELRKRAGASLTGIVRRAVSH